MVLDPDLWNDDGTAKPPTPERMEALNEAQRLEAIDPEVPSRQASMLHDAFINHARIRQDAKTGRPPEVGDIVHGWDEKDGTCRAAMVIQTESFTHNAELVVFIPSAPQEQWYAEHDEEKTSASEGTWHWPCGEGQ